MSPFFPVSIFRACVTREKWSLGIHFNAWQEPGIYKSVRVGNEVRQALSFGCGVCQRLSAGGSCAVFSNRR
jgi:hypothetical protein